MAAITQLAPYAWPGRRYGSFAARVGAAVLKVADPRVSVLTLDREASVLTLDREASVLTLDRGVTPDNG